MSTTNYKTTNAFVVKKNQPKTEDSAPSPQQKLDIKSMIAKAKGQAIQTKSLINETRQERMFPVGTRVFHSSYGVGKVVNIEQNAYTVEFSKHGTKTLDSKTSGLKMF